MADTLDPTTGLPIQDTVAASATQIAQTGNDVSKQLKDQSDGIVSSITAMGAKVKKAHDDLGKIGSDFTKSFKDGALAGKEANDIFGLLAKSYNTLRAATKTTDLFPSTKDTSTGFGTLKDQIHSMGAEWTKTTGILGSGMSGIINSWATNGSFAEKAQQQMIGVASSGGDLNTVFNSQGDLVGDLNAKLLKYTSSLADSAIANGQTLTTTIEYAQGLGLIPGAMMENIDIGTKLGGNVSSLSAAMKLMSGSVQNMGEVLKAMNTAYMDLGNAQGQVNNKAEKGLMLFATMSTLSKDLNLQFGETSGFLSDIAKQFKFVGDNTEAAARVMGQFTQSLRDTGLTSSASLDIIKGMVKGVSELSTGTKAFMSAQSGGPGGLQGAIQIDQLNRAGKSDEVMKMVTDNLKKQFGGKIYTQAEGAQSQEGAAGFTRQRMLLQSGAFGNLVGGKGPESDEKATRLLEALSKGNTSGFKAVTGKDAVEKVATQGESLQKEGNTILNKIAVNTELSQMGIQVLALKNVREYFGTGNKEGATAIKLNQDRFSADESTRDKTKRSLTTNVNKFNLEDIEKENASRFVSAIGSFVSQVGTGSKKIVGDTANALEKAFSDTAALREKLAIQTKAKDIDRATPKGVGTLLHKPTAKQFTAATIPKANRPLSVNNAVSQTKTEHTVKLDLTDDAKKLLKINGQQQPSTSTAPNTQSAPAPGDHPQ